MTSYRSYWLLTAFLLSTAVYAIYAGVPTWAIEKFPQPLTQAVVVFIFTVFVWCYATAGHRAAQLIARNERALSLRERNIHVVGARSEVQECLDRAFNRRQCGKETGQQDFSLLYELTVEDLQNRLYLGIQRIDDVRNFLVGTSLFFTLVGIVLSVGSQPSPTNFEESKLASFNMIKGLGLGYVPAAVCFGSMLVLFVLGGMLQTQVNRVLARFKDELYEVAILGDVMIPTVSPRSPKERRVDHAQTS